MPRLTLCRKWVVFVCFKAILDYFLRVEFLQVGLTGRADEHGCNFKDRAPAVGENTQLLPEPTVDAETLLRIITD